MKIVLALVVALAMIGVLALVQSGVLGKVAKFACGFVNSFLTNLPADAQDYLAFGCS